jgi:ribosomal protein S13
LLKERMSSFNDSSLHAMRKLTGLVNEYGANIPLKAKNCYALEAIKRIGRTRAEEIAKADQRTITAVMGSCNLVAGIVKMDPELVLEGMTELAEVATDVMADLTYEWYEIVSVI